MVGGQFEDKSSLEAWIYNWNTKEWRPTTPLADSNDIKQGLNSNRGSYCSQLNPNGDVITASGLIYRVREAKWETYEYDESLNGPIFYIDELGTAGLIDSNNIEIRPSFLSGTQRHKLYIFKDGNWVESQVQLPKLPYEFLVSSINTDVIPSCKD